MAQTTIIPTRRDIDAWRLEAETAIKFGGVRRLGQFNWPMVVLSLIAQWEKQQEATDLHAMSVEVGQLMQEVRDLKNECKRHAGNVIEAHAYAVKCVRHLPKMRGCAWIDNRPCECRSSVMVHFPEYADAR